MTSMMDRSGSVAHNHDSSPAARRPAMGPVETGPTGPAGRAPRSANGHLRPHPYPRLEQMVWTLVHLFLEVEAGRRPRAHLRPVMCPLLYTRLSQIWFRNTPPGCILRIRGDLVSDDCYEAVAVVRRGERVGAVSVRLIHTREGWRTDDLSRPEDGPLPPPPYAYPADEPDLFELDAEPPALEPSGVEGYS